MSKNRSFVIEPGFLISTGHVPNLLSVLSAHVSKPVYILPVSAPLHNHLDGVFVCERILPDSYAHLLVPSKKINAPLRFVAVLFFVLPGKYARKIRTAYERTGWMISNSVKVISSIRKLDKKYVFTSSDKFIFPNADLMTVFALFLWLMFRKKKRLPRIKLRFINVFENYNLPHILGMKQLLGMSKLLNHRIKCVSIFAETNRYKDQLSNFADNISVAPYPPVMVTKNRMRLVPKKSKFMTVGVLGSARPDKGFTEIPILLNYLAQQSFSVKVNFLVQESVESWGFEYDHAKFLLQTNKHVELLPGYLDHNTILENIQKCDLLLLPYDKSIYRFRGSAMLFEAADLNIPVLAPSHTGFGETIRRFGIGWTYGHLSEIPQLLAGLDHLQFRLKVQNLENYNKVRTQQFDSFLST